MKNKGNLIFTALIAIFGFFIFSSVINAQSDWRNNYDQHWWSYDMANNYRLAPGQVNEINQYRSEYNSKITQLQNDLRGFRIEMNGYSNPDSVVSEKEPPPLPLHGIEGYGGIAVTYSAYLTNTASKGEIFGKPSFGAGALIAESGKYLGFATFTETLWDRLELGYGFNALSLGDLPGAIKNATTVQISDNFVYLHNFNARLSMLKEGEFGETWLPAITGGIHYKYNESVNNIDKELGGALTSIGIEKKDGIDFTLYASKMLTFFPRPVLLNIGARNTQAAHIGLLGFTGDREFVFEGNLVVFLTDRLALGAEYRQKPNSYKQIPGLIGEENDWWSLVFGYVANNNLTISGGYFNLGQVLNKKDNMAFALKAKYEF